MTRVRAKLFASAAALGAAVAGCAPTATAPKPSAGPAPSANVTRLQAWKDAELLAAQGEGRAPAAGQGGSMAPIYGENTMLVISPIAFEDLQPGMVVAYFNRRGFQVVHRLVAPTPQGDWRAIGLNNESEDPEPVTRSNLIGIVYASLVHEERPERTAR